MSILPKPSWHICTAKSPPLTVLSYSLAQYTTTTKYALPPPSSFFPRLLLYSPQSPCPSGRQDLSARRERARLLLVVRMRWLGRWGLVWTLEREAGNGGGSKYKEHSLLKSPANENSSNPHHHLNTPPPPTPRRSFGFRTTAIKPPTVP
jgi:hypothetical protein